MATKTAVIVLCGDAVLICAIPPLSPQPPDFHNKNPTHIPPLFKIPFPDDIVLHSENFEYIRRKMISSWHFSSSQHLYFDMIWAPWQNPKFHRFKVMFEPDFSTASLHVVNTSELTPVNFDSVSSEDYRICEDTLVSCWSTVAPCLNIPSRNKHHWGIFTGSTSAHFSNVPSNGLLLPGVGLRCSYFLCPASGRFVLLDTGRGTLAVLDIL